MISGIGRTGARRARVQMVPTQGRTLPLDWAGPCLTLYCRSEAYGYLKADPQKHLIGTGPDGRINSQFQGWQAGTARLVFTAVPIAAEGPASHALVLGLTELDQAGETTRTWVILDKDHKMIELINQKVSTLPGIFVMDEEMYDRLAGYTYRLSDWDFARNLSPRIALLEAHSISAAIA